MLAAIFNLVFREGNMIYLHYESNVGPKGFVNIDWA